MTRHLQFASPNLLWFPLIIFGLFICTAAPFRPELVPVNYIPGLEKLISFLPQKVLVAICVGAWIAHFAKAIYIAHVCRKLKTDFVVTFLWTIQTFILGIASTSLCLKMAKQVKSK